jgi:glycosyltransferase involved in cell wall biosynthesis
MNDRPQNDVLLTVSGVINPDIHAAITRGERPEADYIRLQRSFGADLIDYPAAARLGGVIGRVMTRIAGRNAGMAWACFRLRNKYRVIFTDGEQVGIPLAALLKVIGGRQRPAHLMISHVLSVYKKMIFFDRLKVHTHIDTFFVYSSWQKHFIEQRWRIPAKRVIFTPFMVDAQFFSPEQAHPNARESLGAPDLPLVCSVGLEFRDYPTLMKAVEGLHIHAVIAAGSPWSKRPDSTANHTIPDNVTVRRFSQYDLRDLYALSNFVVMPLYPVDFQAGVTAILEAMAMGKAVICTQTPGQTDVITQNETGLYVPPGNPDALRAAIQFLLDHPDEADRMGANGHRRVLAEMSLDCYAERLAHQVEQARENQRIK